MGRLFNQQQINTVLLALCLLMSNCAKAEPFVIKGVKLPDFQLSHFSTGIVSDKSDVKIKLSADTDQDDALPSTAMPIVATQHAVLNPIIVPQTRVFLPYYSRHARAPPANLV